jgi:hypothetical protein
MLKFEQLIIEFCCLLGLTAFFSYRGYDDLVYTYFARKLPMEAAGARIVWVVIKGLTSLVGGVTLALACYVVFSWSFPAFLESKHAINVASNFMVLAILLFAGLVGLAIGALQNVIRRFCGRPERPWFDWTIIRKNLRQWQGKDWLE